MGPVEQFADYAGVSGDERTVHALHARQDIVTMSLQAYAAVLTPAEPGLWAHATRAAIALRIAEKVGDDSTSALIAGLELPLDETEWRADVAAGLRPLDGPAWLPSALDYVDAVTAAPATAGPTQIEGMKAAGIASADIVRLAEIAATIAYHVRVVAGLRADSAPEEMAFDVPSKAFTAVPMGWSPYIVPVQLEQATPQQVEAMKVTPSNRKISAYTLVLAHDPESLAVRSPLFNAIMYHRVGLSRAGRELGAVAASIVNGCVYCASVHSDRFILLTKEADVIADVFAHGRVTGENALWQAVFASSARLSQARPQWGAQDVAALRAAGLDRSQRLDLILSVAMFAWANRLMLSLGAVVSPDA